MLRFLVKITWLLSFSGKNDAESFINFVKMSYLDPKRAKLDQNSDFSHVRTYSCLHKLRNTQGKIHGTYLGNIYGIYQECIRSIHRYLWEKIIRNTGAAFGGRPIGAPPKAAPVCLMEFIRTCVSGHDRSQSFGSISHVSGPEMVFWWNL